MVEFSEYLQDSVKRIKIDAAHRLVDQVHFVRKVFWLAALVVGSSLCVALIVSAFNEYARYQVTTTYRLVGEQQAVFPAVTICNMNQFTTEYAQQYVSLLNHYSPLEEIVASSKQAFSFLDAGTGLLGYLGIYYGVERLNKLITGSYMSNEQIRRMSDFESILVDCTIGSVKCNASHFTPTLDTIFLNCYSFNADTEALHVADEAGLVNNRLSVLLNASAPSSAVAASLMPMRGFFIKVRNASIAWTDSVPSPFTLTPGMGALFSVRRFIFEQWPKPYSRCQVSVDNKLSETLDDSYYFDYVVAQNNRSYTWTNCFGLCMQQFIVKECNCTFIPLGYSLPNVGKCLSSIEYNCAYSFYANKQIASGSLTSACMSKCPLECHIPALYTTMSTYNASTFGHKDKSDLVEFSVYYDSLSYTLVTEKPKITLEALVGSIGGSLHVFLGMSFASFFELADLILHVFCFILFKGK